MAATNTDCGWAPETISPLRTGFSIVFPDHKSWSSLNAGFACGFLIIFDPAAVPFFCQAGFEAIQIRHPGFTGVLDQIIDGQVLIINEESLVIFLKISQTFPDLLHPPPQ